MESENLYKLGARYYDATIGRFTQADPSGPESQPYGYAMGNPIMLLDPTGLDTSGEALLQGAVGGLIGGTVTLTCGAFVAGISGGVLLAGGGGYLCGVAGAAVGALATKDM